MIITILLKLQDFEVMSDQINVVRKQKDGALVPANMISSQVGTFRQHIVLKRIYMFKDFDVILNFKDLDDILNIQF